jgi:sarcosine oxidase subunit gamma
VAERDHFALDEITDWRLTQIAGWKPADFETFATALSGMVAPSSVGDVVKREDVSLIRIAPDRLWLIEEAASFVLRLGRIPTNVCVTSLTEGRRRFRLSGELSNAVLSRCIAIDLDDPGLAPGKAVQTCMHRVGVLIHRLSLDSFDLYAPRSFSVSLHQWVTDIVGSLAAR